MAKVTGVGAALMLIAVALMYMTVGQLHLRIERAQTAVDFAALAAADALRGLFEAEPCAIAETVLKQNGEMLYECHIHVDTVTVVTRISVLSQKVGLVARAGPPV